MLDVPSTHYMERGKEWAQTKPPQEQRQIVLVFQGGGALGETGAPACYSGGGLSDEPDRRIIYGAIINCSEVDVHGNTGGPLPVVAFGKFFITEPVASDGTIFTELVGTVEPGTVSNNVAHDLVQLYR